MAIASRFIGFYSKDKRVSEYLFFHGVVVSTIVDESASARDEFLEL